MTGNRPIVKLHATQTVESHSCTDMHTRRLEYPGRSWRLPAAGSQCDRSIGPELELVDTSENNRHSDGHSFHQESAALLEGRGNWEQEKAD